MSATALSIINKAKRGVNLPTTDVSTYTDEECLDWLNEGLTLFSVDGLIDFEEASISVSSSTRKYALPAGSIIVRFAFINGEGSTLSPWSPEDFNRFGGVTATGKPTNFYQEGESILLYPMPDASYTLNVYTSGTPAELTATSDVISLGRPYTDALRYWLQYQMLLRESDPNANSYGAIWTDMLTAAKNLDKNREGLKYAGEIKDGQNPSGIPRNGLFYYR